MKAVKSCIRSRGFKLAITSEIIGKLGGRVEEAAVPGREITAANVVVHTVKVPPGKSLLVGFVCRFSKTSSLASNWPELKLGDAAAIAGRTGADIGIAAVLTETSSITISAGSGTLSATLSGGTVYTSEI